jgi:hypothetical protein
MQRTWRLPGGYATWSLTLTTGSVEGAIEPFVDDWTPEDVDRIGEHFVDIVNLLECLRALNEQPRPGSICS